MISSETALKLSYMEADAAMSTSRRLRLAKEIFEYNNNRDMFVLSSQDINFIEITESLCLTEREKNIMYITQFFHACYVDYNIERLVCKNKLPPIAIDRLMKMYSILETYDLLHLLFSDGVVLTISEFEYTINS